MCWRRPQVQTYFVPVASTTSTAISHRPTSKPIISLLHQLLLLLLLLHTTLLPLHLLLLLSPQPAAPVRAARASHWPAPTGQGLLQTASNNRRNHINCH